MDEIQKLIEAIRLCSPEQKQQIFSEIRDSITIHQLEKVFHVRAEVILEAIARSSDLTQRGVRGVIAETVFALDIVPALKRWKSIPVVGDLSYDTLLRRDKRDIRVQVKMQRKLKGQAWLRRGSYIVEVQRTRGGDRGGVSTRPYRFGSFDLLAVCMQASTGSWHSFLYIPESKLKAKASNRDEIETLQEVPQFERDQTGHWTPSLETALDRLR